jgi:hypothetical protein
MDINHDWQAWSRENQDSMMPATSVEPPVVAHVEVARVVPDGIATVMRTLATMPMLVRASRTFRQIEATFVNCCFLARTHRLN